MVVTSVQGRILVLVLVLASGCSGFTFGRSLGGGNAHREYLGSSIGTGGAELYGGGSIGSGCDYKARGCVLGFGLRGGLLNAFGEDTYYRGPFASAYVFSELGERIAIRAGFGVIFGGDFNREGGENAADSALGEASGLRTFVELQLAVLSLKGLQWAPFIALNYTRSGETENGRFSDGGMFFGANLLVY